MVYTWDAQAATWKTYDPALPPEAGTLTSVHERMGLWVKVSSAATLEVTGQRPATTGIPLYLGWNMVGFPASAPRDPAAALASVADKVSTVLGYDPGRPENPWRRYRPAAPPFANDLAALQPGQGYWILVAEPCNWEVAY